MHAVIIGVNLAGIMGDAWRAPKVGTGVVPSGWEWEGCPLSRRIRDLGKRCELPQRGPGQIPGRKWILAYFEGHRTILYFLYLYDKI